MIIIFKTQDSLSVVSVTLEMLSKYFQINVELPKGSQSGKSHHATDQLCETNTIIQLFIVLVKVIVLGVDGALVVVMLMHI